MKPERTALSPVAAVRRRLPAAATAQRGAASPSPSPARKLQERLGNQGTQAFVARSAKSSQQPAVGSKTPKAPAPAPAAPSEKAAKPERAAKPEKAEKPASPSPRKAIAEAAHQVGDRASKARQHGDAAPLVGSAQAAAKEPKTEQTRGAAVATVGALDAAKTEQVRRDDFKSKLREAIEKATPQPKTESEADSVMKTGAKNASATLQGSLATQRDAAAGDLKTANAAEASPDTQPAPPKEEMKLEKAGPAPAPVSAAPVVPAPMPAKQLDYSSDRSETDTAMADAGVTTEQLGKGNEPQFNKTLSERDKAVTHEKSVEAKYRGSEAKIHAQTLQEAQGQIGVGLASIHSERELQLGKVTTQQTTTKTKDAAERQRITNTIDVIKVQTRNDVAAILNDMDTQAAAIFEAGLKRAEAAYDAAFEEAKGGVGTWLTTWGDDWTKHIERALATGRREYLRQVGVAIDEVADLVEGKLAAAKKRVADGRKQVEDFVQGLDKSVAGLGEEALREVSAEFDALGREIDERRDKLVDSLSQQYKASYERMSAREEELREANKSLWQRVYDATVGVIKKIIEFKNMLLGVLQKAANVIMDIICDPIGFLGNLVEGVMRGLEGFKSRIGEHLKRGLMEWLFGALAAGGLKMPENFDLQGIVSIILQVLGLTYENFRARAVAIVGEPVVAGIEKVAEIFMIVKKEGVSGLWRFIKEKVNDLKSMVMDAIFDFIKERVIIAGITWLVGLLNPASAFFKACKAIYDIVMFFINRGSQILALVNAIIDSIAAIAKGSLDTAAKWVENALAKTIPVAIGFLASLLGLGDISGTVKKTIDKAREPVNKAIDWAINLAAKAVKGLAQAGLPQDPLARLHQGMEMAEKTVNRFAGKKVGKLVLIPLLTAIKVRYGLKSLDVVSVGTDWWIEGKINPEEKRKTEAKVGEGGAEAGDKKMTVQRATTTLGGDTVGTSMTVDWLGEEHTKGGTTPESGVHDKLMGHLVTNPSESSENKFIRGHLLNEHLGGRGNAENMFPITGNANSQHLHSTEKTVKSWVKKKDRWVFYEVKVINISSKLDAGPKHPGNYVEAVFACRAILKDATGKPEEDFATNITSGYGKKGTAAKAVNIPPPGTP